MKSTKVILLFSAFFGFLSVALGAFAAHGLKHRLDEYARGLWSTAVEYQMFHALALLGLAALMSQLSLPRLQWVGYSWIAGIILFSGSLYLLALTGVRVLGMVTPIGGLAFLVGWTLLFWVIATHK
jgi:uncharacterized membrane protein YgdD (TMEM256/DUF423 family)